MEEQKESKTKPCCCSVLLGVLVIVFAWWQVRWGAMALTVLGVLVILKTLIPSCCCRSMLSCKK
jgi:hypothetical protein